MNNRKILQFEPQITGVAFPGLVEQSGLATIGFSDVDFAWTEGTYSFALREFIRANLGSGFYRERNFLAIPHYFRQRNLFRREIEKYFTRLSKELTNQLQGELDLPVSCKLSLERWAEIFYYNIGVGVKPRGGKFFPQHPPIDYDIRALLQVTLEKINGQAYGGENRVLTKNGERPLFCYLHKDDTLQMELL